MNSPLALCAAFLALAAAAPAAADCTLSADANAAVRPVSMSDTNLIISMSTMPKLLHVDYAGATATDGCDVGQFTVGGVRYDVYGADGPKGRSRRAVPAKAGQPAAIIVPVVDIMKALEASKQGKAAQTEGYMLATIGKDDFIGWQLYVGMPDQPTLLRDMAAILNGQGKPIFENKGNNTSLFVPKQN